MNTTQNNNNGNGTGYPPLAQAWAEWQTSTDHNHLLEPDSHRLAFADPEFMTRRDTLGVRLQLELLKPDLALEAMGIENTLVVYGSARLVSREQALAQQEKARASGDAQAIGQAELAVRNARYYEDARTFARLIASCCQGLPSQRRLVICTGGGPGVMEAANRGAHDVGAPSIGLNIALPHEQSGNPYVTPALSFKFHYFALRKMHFMMRARALVAFPGGFGTLDELFEVLTLVQTNKVKPVPIILYGRDYWQAMLRLVDQLAAEGAISPGEQNLLEVVDTPEDACNRIRAFYRF
ncbi:MAG: TIGR00730 family Rossman fold protein [Burkholderiaceae bacterium]|jgi:uncharacterized protein (TIGR00730 family)|nr:TIGR00730 family Rossman fold protein [Burkholderiaceae bacterium]